jgi:hypothetical protein
MMLIPMTLLALAAGFTVTSVARGPMSAIIDSKEVVARSDAEWKTLWQESGSAQPLPAVDFSKEMVAAVFLGSRPTGGYSVEIVGARLEGEVLIIDYAERRPGRAEIVTQVLTSPFHMVRLPAHKGPVRFQKQ